MKTPKIQFAAAALVVAAALVQPVKAALIEKADNSTALNVAGAWTNNVVPGTADIAQWDSTVTAANTTNTLGAALTWSGIRIANPAAPVLINAGSTLTIGAGGIDMSAATVNLSLSNAVTIGSAALQQWNVAAGHTLSVLAVPNKPGQPSGNTGVLQVGTTGTVQLGTATTPIINDNQGNPWVTYGSNDWAALDGSGNVIAASYTAASSALMQGVINDITGNVAGGAASAGAISALRFNDSTAWTLQIANSATTRTLTVRGILVTANCAGGLINGYLNGSDSFIRPNRSTVANTSFNIIQNSPADFTIAVNISDGSSSAPTHVVKSGPGNLILSTPGYGSGGTDINGGSVTLSAGATMGGGAVNINSGRLAVIASNTTYVASVTVNNGATNAIKIGTAAAQQYISSVTFNAGVTACEFDYSNGIVASSSAAPLLVSNLVANGAISVNFICGSPVVGTFPLIKYTNSFTGTGFSAFSLGVMPLRTTGYLSNDTANSSIDLVVTNISEPLSWATGNGVWDIATTANWKDALGNATTYQQVSSLADQVVFNDSASGPSPVTVALNINPMPSSVTVSNNTINYVISGGGSISGGTSLTKAGSGTLTLATANSFSGGININAGLVSFSALTNLGSGAITFGGGTLQYNGNSDDISVRTVSFKTGGGTIDTAGQTVNYANPIGTGAGGGLTKTGAGTLTLNGTNNIAGIVLVNQGTLALGVNSYVSNSSAIIVNSGATLDANSSSVNLTLSTASSQILGGVGTVSGNVTAPAGTVITPATNGVYGTLNFANNLTVSGATLIMDVANGSKDLITVGGNLSISSGSLLVITNATPLANGIYKLIQYSGSLSSGAGSSGNLTIQFSQAGKSATLSDATAGEIDLIIASSGGDAVTWSGIGSSWDLAGSQSWFIGGSTPWAFTNGDNVTFNDSASGNSTVNLQAVVLPASVIVSNTAIATYTFADGTGTGGGKIGGTTSVVKDGTGTAIFQTANTYSGTTTIKSGTLLIGNGGSGDIGTGNVTNNGALVFGQSDGGTHTVAGAISGTGSVTQQGTATVVLTQNNTYSGATTISSGTLQVGTGGATGSLSAGAVTNNGTLILNRSGTVVLVNNISGTGTLSKQGSSALTFAGGLNYQGNTYISNGVVSLTANDQIPDANTVSGSTGWLILDGSATAAGTFDLTGFNETVNALSGLGSTFNGVITNSGISAATTNVLTVLGIAGTTYNGIIADNTNGSKTAVVLLGANTLRMNGVSTYSGVTTVGGTATIGVGPGATLGAGGIIMSNGTTYYMYNNGSTASFPHDNITIVDGANANMNSGQTGNGFSGTVSGRPNSTNSIIGPVSAGTANVEQWSNFLGTVLVPSGGSIRFSSTSLTLNGSDNATFDLEGTGGVSTRNQGTVHLGALQGNGTIYNPGSATAGTFATFIIGSKGTSTTFSGAIQGTNSIVKSGAGTLTLSSGSVTNISSSDGFTYTTNILYTNTLSYLGSTTISNGVLQLVVPQALTNWPGAINLASASAVFDASQMGYIYSPDGVTQTLVTNSTLEIISGQALNGQGGLYGFLQADAGSMLNPGNTAGNIASGTGTGILTVSSNATLNGAINLRLNNTNAVISDELAAPGYTISGATLVITNIGPALAGGNVFHLFSSGINTSGFTSIILPTVVSPLVLSNNLALDGTLVIVAPYTVNTNPTNIVYSVTNNGAGNTLLLSWPADHTGWYLQMQTNSLSVGLNTNWVDVAGSSTTNSVGMPVDATKPSVFYRLSLQP